MTIYEAKAPGSRIYFKGPIDARKFAHDLAAKGTLTSVYRLDLPDLNRETVAALLNDPDSAVEERAEIERHEPYGEQGPKGLYERVRVTRFEEIEVVEA